ncbi:hypothetical protein DPX16_22925 [Anabarilius grahami]|uniref:Uncharacterized protein n=1 Tax=Anabarilius grahami TaxID=495550 RepID=A0A3N0YGD9_ANAGA|nr:hypothetical protein DPX16_22925 [Anabarilius grahami]
MTLDMCKDGDRTEQPKEITGLQEALTAAGHREQLENATKQDLERELFHTKTLLKTANVTQVPDLPWEEAMDGSILIPQTPQYLQQQAATTTSSTPFTQQPSRGCIRTTGHTCIGPTGASNAKEPREEKRREEKRREEKRREEKRREEKRREERSLVLTAFN